MAAELNHTIVPAHDPRSSRCAARSRTRIRVNCITPETILTEGNQDRIPAALQASLADAHRLKRLGTPQDVRPPPRSWPLIRPPGSPA